MWGNPITLLSSVIPIFYCQLYFPDENTGGFMKMPPPSEVSRASAPILPPVTNLTEIRGTTIYEQYVDRIISSGILKLTLDVQKALLALTPNNYNTIVYSPINIAEALALVLLGSNGKTFDELITIMGLDVNSKSQLIHEEFGRLLEKVQSTFGLDLGGQINFATAVFVQEEYPIRQVFKQSAESVYDSEVLHVDFASNPAAAQNTINAWVSDRTEGKISDILGETPSPATKVVLASAMYFKAEWEKPFFDGSTKRRPFYTNGKHTDSDVMVEMMANGGLFPYYKDTTLDCEIIGFPYKGNKTTMYVVIPQHSNKEKLKQLESNLNASEIERLVNNVQYAGVIVIFPKMTIEATIDLRKVLLTLGLKSLFDPLEANLALISPGLGASAETLQNPIPVENDVLIFTKSGWPVNGTQIFNPSSNVSTCEEIVNGTEEKVTYKKFGRRIDVKVASRISESLDNVREALNQGKSAENPGLYADTVVHKVYMDITESGTEAAATSTVSLSRDGGRATVRVDVPFFFFIMHEETKALLFWGSVNTPTPSFT